MNHINANNSYSANVVSENLIAPALWGIRQIERFVKGENERISFSIKLTRLTIAIIGLSILIIGSIPAAIGLTIGYLPFYLSTNKFQLIKQKTIELNPEEAKPSSLEMLRQNVQLAQQILECSNPITENNEEWSDLSRLEQGGNNSDGISALLQTAKIIDGIVIAETLATLTSELNREENEAAIGMSTLRSASEMEEVLTLQQTKEESEVAIAETLAILTSELNREESKTSVEISTSELAANSLRTSDVSLLTESEIQEEGISTDLFSTRFNSDVTYKMIEVKIPENINSTEEERILQSQAVEEFGLAPEMIGLIYTMCQAFNEVAEQFGIKYIANGGTFIGCVRHKAFVRWDDDADLQLLLGEEKKIAEIDPNDHRYLKVKPEVQEAFAERGFKLAGHWGGWKLCPITPPIFARSFNDRPIERQFCWPFVDIFISKKRDEDKENILVDVNANSSFPKAQLWRQEYFPNIKEPAAWMQFGPIKMPVAFSSLEECEKYLARAYGAEWKTHAVIKFNHKEGCHVRPARKFKLVDYTPGPFV